MAERFFALPAKDAEHGLALRLLAHDSSIDLDVVDALVGHPQRYSDLKRLLHDRDDKVLDRALARLRGEGIIQQGYDVPSKQKRYGLTAIGKLVVYRVQQLRPPHEAIEAYRRAQDAAQAA